MTKRIGVLALQGAVEPHRPHIEACGASFHAVKTQADFKSVDAFILPGGESTTMLKLIDTFGLWDVLADEFARKPVWGICAGAILLATHVKNPAQKSFALLDMTATRNAYGRQLDSHYAEVDGYPVSFIRAPILEAIGRDVGVLALHQGQPAWVEVRRANGTLVMASTFHPELTRTFPSPMHKRFISSV